MKVLVALGGNAILARGQAGTAAEQYATMRATSRRLVRFLRHGHRLVVTHGNGPQVGDILLAYESAKGVIPPMPLDVCGAQSQGMIGYMLQMALQNELEKAGMEIPVVTLLTRTEVDEKDPAFSNPTKPVGPFYSKMEASSLTKKGWSLVKVGSRSFRRVVPSPRPVKILEVETIGRLFRSGALVVASGGGGIPVALDPATGLYHGVEAVIDKDLSASLLARALRLDMLLILTDVDGLYRNFGRRNQKLVPELTTHEARADLRGGAYPPGSMGPKVEAAVEFVDATGKPAVISSLQKAEQALAGEAGTRILPP